MGYCDGSILGVEKIVGQEPRSSGMNVVLVAEGYTYGEQTHFALESERFAEMLFDTAPFDTCGQGINVYRVHVASAESGLKDPWWPCEGTGYWPRTFLDASYCNYGIRRLVLVNDPLARWVLQRTLPEWHVAIVVVNGWELGGSGGEVAVATAYDDSWPIMAIHELGHSGFDLGDEYSFFVGCDSDGPEMDHYTGPEPAEPNITTEQSLGNLKWRRMVQANTSIPTLSNPDCAHCDTQSDPTRPRTVGLFEGATWYHCGAFRPAYSCLMRELDKPFCPVCDSVIREKLSRFGSHSNLTIRPWGFAAQPPVPPLWTSPDIEVDSASSRLRATVSNRGNRASDAFRVRASYVATTGLTNLPGSASAVLIGESNESPLQPGDQRTVEFKWDSSSIRAFTVRVEILADECVLSGKVAMSRYLTVPYDKVGGKVKVPVSNLWPAQAESSLEVCAVRSADQPGLLAVSGADPVTLQSGEERVLEIVLERTETFAATEDPVVDIVQRLDGQDVGGFSVRVGSRESGESEPTDG